MKGDDVRRFLSIGFVAAALLMVLSPLPAKADPLAVPKLLHPSENGQLNGGPGQLFTVRADHPGHNATDVASVVLYEATIEVLSGTTVVRTFTTPPAVGGSEATGTPTVPVPQGSYTWRAKARQLTAGVGLPGPETAWSAAKPFHVSSPPNSGGGEVNGDATFAAPGLPGILMPCETTNFTLGRIVAEPDEPPLSGGIVVNIQGAAYAGPFELSGTGSGDCANALAGSGRLNVVVDGRNRTGGTIYCNLLGGFARLLSDVQIAVAGNCTINGLTTGRVNFRSEVQFRPDPGQGLTTRVTHAVFAGYFTVTPA